mgnify:CR=1 FL=1
MYRRVFATGLFFDRLRISPRISDSFISIGAGPAFGTASVERDPLAYLEQPGPTV